MARLQPIEHPVMGLLVPDKWGSYMTFREFPFMKPFWYPDRERAMSFLKDHERKWFEDWRGHFAELSRACRNMNVLAALQSMGIYEITIAGDEEDDEGSAAPPTDAQVAAFEYFVKNEERICTNVTNAMMRYYNVARQEMADWFDEDDDYPDDPTVEQFGKIIAFDGFSLTSSTSHGMAALRFGWDPDWDSEHGLLAAVYKDQALAIGTENVDYFLEDPEVDDEFGVWGENHMTEAEQAIRREFIEGFESPDDDDF